MTLPAFARECEWCHHHFDDHVAHWWHVDRDNLAAWMTASRARAMAGRSAIVEAVEGMVVDERAWRWHEVDSMSFEPDGDPVDAFAYHDGPWSYEDPFGPDEASGQSTNIRTAMLAVQRAHAAHALSVCGSATSGGR